MSWITRGSREVYENPWIRVREDDVITPGGEPGLYGVVSLQNPSVFVVPVTKDNEVVLVRQWRYTVERHSWEVPAGGSDGEEPEVAAQRELREEAGYVAERMTVLPQVFSLNGVCDAPGFVVVAEDLTRVSDGAEIADEGISGTATLPWTEVFEWIKTGQIHDGESITALMHAGLALGRIA